MRRAHRPPSGDEARPAPPRPEPRQSNDPRAPAQRPQGVPAHHPRPNPRLGPGSRRARTRVLSWHRLPPERATAFRGTAPRRPSLGPGPAGEPPLSLRARIRVRTRVRTRARTRVLSPANAASSGRFGPGGGSPRPGYGPRRLNTGVGLGAGGELGSGDTRAAPSVPPRALARGTALPHSAPPAQHRALADTPAAPARAARRGTALSESFPRRAAPRNPAKSRAPRPRPPCVTRART